MVLGWLTKIVIVLAMLGVAGFDAVSVGVAHLSAKDDASTAAHAAADSWRASHNIQAAYSAAVAAVSSHDETVPAGTFSVAPDGTVYLSVDKKATTLLLWRIPRLKDWVRVEASSSASSPL